MEQYQPPLDAVFQALADPTRRAVIGRLGRGPASIGALAAPFAMALPSFMKHVRVLEESGWITTRKQGRVRICAIEPRAMALAQGWLAAQSAAWEARTDRIEAFLGGEDQSEDQP